jgi:hypothetical protein
MSENSTLISYNGKIRREELTQVPTPPSTETLPHNWAPDQA